MLSVEGEWSITAHDRALSIDGGPMWIMVFTFRIWHKLRPSGPN
jgi:hypothetical protein